MRRGKRIRPGRHLVVDERSGITKWDDELAYDWDRLVVDRNQLDGDHPQHYVRGLQDPYPIQPIRPLQGTDFDQVCGHYIMEYFPRTTIKRPLSQNDDLLPLPGIGQMAIGTAANECGHWFVVGPAEDTLVNFAFVADTFISSENDNILVTTHTVNLPNGLDIGNLSAAKRVIVLFTSEGVNDLTIPGSWTELQEVTNSTVTLHVFYRDLDGTEGFSGTDDSITVTTDNIASSSYLVYLIQNFNTSVPPEVSTGATGSSLSPDPDNLGLSETEDWLILAVEAHNTASTEATIPIRYSNKISSRS